MVGFDDLAFHISAQTEDSRNLGRWSLITITGKNRLKNTFISRYCHVFSDLPRSSYAQQLTYIAEHEKKNPDNIVGPRQMFGYNLRKVVAKYSNMGHRLIICGDFNSNYESLLE